MSLPKIDRRTIVSAAVGGALIFPVGIGSAKSNELSQPGDVSELIRAFSIAFDGKRWDSMADILAESATLTMHGKTWRGRDSIVNRYKAFYKHARELVTHIDVVSITFSANDKCRVETYQSIYSTISSVPSRRGPALVGHFACRDELHLAQTWLIRSRSVGDEFFLPYPW